MDFDSPPVTGTDATMVEEALPWGSASPRWEPVEIMSHQTQTGTSEFMGGFVSESPPNMSDFIPLIEKTQTFMTVPQTISPLLLQNVYGPGLDKGNPTLHAPYLLLTNT